MHILNEHVLVPGIRFLEIAVSSSSPFCFQIEGVCVSDLTQCYFPGAIVPDDWASCTVSSVVTNLPTCSACYRQGNVGNMSAPLAGTQWCSSSETEGPYDDYGKCVSANAGCPTGFLQGSSPPNCLHASLPSPFFNCFSCVLNGYTWIASSSAGPYFSPNIGVCLPPSAVSNFSQACPLCKSEFSFLVFQELWQCPAHQLASCAACTSSGFVWCPFESRCANAIGSCINQQNAITSLSRCLFPSTASSLPTCSSCLQQNGPLQSYAQISQWCVIGTCCGSNVTGATSIISSVFNIKGNFPHLQPSLCCLS